MIDLTIHEEQLERAVRRARERNIIIPTYAQQKDPSLVPAGMLRRLEDVGLWDLNPANLFRITWHNAPQQHGGLYGDVNVLEIPPELSGVPARIICLVGKWFPTGAHKVGATYGCLVPRLVTGQFDPTSQKAVWPSTGNYCRGGAYNSNLLGCESIALLPEEMSRERFEWLAKVAGEVIATPGCESNVKEIFDKCWELRATRDDVSIFNQFDEMGNHLWHYEVTGHAMQEVLERHMADSDRFAGVVLTTGSAGTLGSADYLKELYPGCKVAGCEALQCPTLLNNGFGGHRIEGIGDKHVPWIHNARNTDMIAAIDDADCMAMLRLFNEPVGQDYLLKQGVAEAVVRDLDKVGISGMANVAAAIKMAKYYELTNRDVVLTVLTDSMELYGSRITELREAEGEYTLERAARGFWGHLMGLKTDSLAELSYQDKKRIHNLKYYTWVEQQGRTVEELDRQWYDAEAYWGAVHAQVDEMDRLTDRFNEKVGLLAKL